MSKYLNAKEYSVLYTIMHSEEPINVPQITKLHPELSANIVQPAIRKLLKLKLIEVADITIDGNSFSRRFKPTDTATDTIQKMFADEYIMFSKLVSEQTLMSAITRIEKNPEKVKKEISEVERLLLEYKEATNKARNKENL
ncbi:MAG: hypothetical protein K1W26_16725 [Acetatifactor sp.]